MDNFDLKKYLAEGKLLKEEEKLNFTKLVQDEPHLDVEEIVKFFVNINYPKDKAIQYAEAAYELDEPAAYQSTTAQEMADDFNLYFKEISGEELDEGELNEDNPVTHDINL